MKKLLFISLLVVVAMTANAQKALRVYTVDTLSADTITFEYTGKKVNTFSGTAGFTFTVDAIAQTNDVQFEGSYDASTWYVIADSTDLASGDYQAFDTPPSYLYYRLNCLGESGDQTGYGVTFIWKEE